ncbi:MotA/TolQ/ExbB proton channel family protein [Planctomicrobium sp. SH527]|uniref:MotA/TolQ/ExbB proton channel family protein n=1 Tax=Planctomicrobium sp. SH527 TaxID=3448123 RepID=UPI003F5AE67D
MRLNASPRSISVKVGLIAFIVFASWWGVSNSVAIAQDEAAAPPAAPAAAEPAAAEAPADAAEVPAATSEGGHGASKSYLWWIIESSGLIGLFLLIISIFFVAKVFQQMGEIRLVNIAPASLIEECEELLNARDYPGIYRRVKDDPSTLGTLLTAGLTELQYGLTEAREAMDIAAEVRVANQEKNIAMLAVIGTLGPMIGLLGTLKGMIASFSVIALSDTQLKSSEVAGGISEALILTFEGVLVSVPAIYFYAVLKNRISAHTAEAVLMADLFLRRLNTIYRGSKSGEEQAST